MGVISKIIERVHQSSAAQSANHVGSSAPKRLGSQDYMSVLLFLEIKGTTQFDKITSNKEPVHG
jgi:hypothetical protein